MRGQELCAMSTPVVVACSALDLCDDERHSSSVLLFISQQVVEFGEHPRSKELYFLS